MKECIRFAPMIGAREGELDAVEAKALSAHLATCETCRAMAADAAVTEGMIAEALLATASTRDFSSFADGVMARVERPAPRAGFFAWLGRHRRAAAGTLVPVLAAIALLVYVRVEGRREPIALLELSSEGEATTVLQTTDGPVVLLQEESGS